LIDIETILDSNGKNPIGFTVLTSWHGIDMLEIHEIISLLYHLHPHNLKKLSSEISIGIYINDILVLIAF
jgi:hypothetical protein